MFFDIFGAYLEGGAVGSTKGCACVCYYKMQCMTQVIQKLGHHTSNLCFVTLWAGRRLDPLCKPPWRYDSLIVPWR